MPKNEIFSILEAASNRNLKNLYKRFSEGKAPNAFTDFCKICLLKDDGNFHDGKKKFKLKYEKSVISLVELFEQISGLQIDTTKTVKFCERCAFSIRMFNNTKKSYIIARQLFSISKSKICEENKENGSAASADDASAQHTATIGISIPSTEIKMHNNEDFSQSSSQTDVNTEKPNAMKFLQPPCHTNQNTGIACHVNSSSNYSKSKKKSAKFKEPTFSKNLIKSKYSMTLTAKRNVKTKSMLHCQICGQFWANQKEFLTHCHANCKKPSGNHIKNYKYGQSRLIRFPVWRG